MVRIVAIAAVLWMASVGAFAGDNFHPSYAVHVIPQQEKGFIASTDVREICAGKGAYKDVPQQRCGTYSQCHRTSQDAKTKHAVMDQSGVPWKDRAHYEDDHYGPLALGFTNDIRNRWAQPRFGMWRADKKDQMENYAQDAVCKKEVDLAAAQSWFQTKANPDWRVPYCRLVDAGKLDSDPDCANLNGRDGSGR